jgi:hypothetical protein
MLRMRLLGEMTLEEIGQQLGVTRQAVCSGVNNALARVRPMLLADPVVAEAVA